MAVDDAPQWTEYPTRPSAIARRSLLADASLQLLLQQELFVVAAVI